MKEEQLAYRYRKFKSANPMVGNYINLSSAIRGMRYGKMKVYDAFNKYVPKGDYAQDEKDMLMNNLVVVTNSVPSNILPLFLANEEVGV